MGMTTGYLSGKNTVSATNLNRANTAQTRANTSQTKVSTRRAHEELIDYINDRDERQRMRELDLESKATSNELQETQADSAAYNFDEYKARRGSRDKAQDAADVQSEGIIGAKDAIIEGIGLSAENNNAQLRREQANKQQLDENYTQQIRMQYMQDKMAMGKAKTEQLVGIGAYLEELGVKNITGKTYDTVYNHLLQAFGGDAKMVEQSYGITADHSPENMTKLYSLSKLAMHDQATTRAEHLIANEWQLKLQQARIEAGATQGRDLSYEIKPDEYKFIGTMISQSMKAFDDLQGSYNEDTGLYSGAQGHLVSTIARLAATANVGLIAGDDFATVADYQYILSDLMASGNYIKDTGWLGWEHGGDSFDSLRFQATAQTIFSTMEANRLAYPDLKAGDLWKVIKESVVKRLISLEEAETAMYGKRPQGDDTPTHEGSVGTGIKMSPRQKKQARGQINSEIKEVQALITHMNSPSYKGKKGPSSPGATESRLLDQEKLKELRSKIQELKLELRAIK